MNGHEEDFMGAGVQMETPFVFNGRRASKARVSQRVSPKSSAPSPLAVAGRRTKLEAVPPLNKQHHDAEYEAFRREAPRDVVVEGVTILGRVVSVADDFELSLHDIAAAVLDPEQTWLGQNGSTTVHLRGQVAAIVSNDFSEVVAVAERERALEVKRQPRDGAIRRSSGGAGLRFPNDIGELLHRARGAGIDVLDDRNHYVLRLPSSSEQVVCPRTPSDYNAIPNVCGEVRRRFGVDLRKGVTRSAS